MKVIRPAFAINFGSHTISGLVLQERYQADLTPTVNPVDSGSPMVDHIRQESPQFGAQILISNSPITYSEEGTGSLDLDPQFFQGGIHGVAGAVTAAIGTLQAATLPEKYTLQGVRIETEDLISEMFDLFDEIHRTRAVVQIVAGLKSYDNMVIQSAPRSRSTGSGSMAVDITATQIRTAIVALGASAIPRSPSAAIKKALGKAKVVEAADPNKGSMAFEYIKDKLGG